MDIGSQEGRIISDAVWVFSDNPSGDLLVHKWQMIKRGIEGRKYISRNFRKCEEVRVTDLVEALGALN